ANYAKIVQSRAILKIRLGSRHGKRTPKNVWESRTNPAVSDIYGSFADSPIKGMRYGTNASDYGRNSIRCQARRRLRKTTRIQSIGRSHILPCLILVIAVCMRSNGGSTDAFAG